MITNFHKIDKHKSFLLIGIGETNKYLHEIVKPEYLEEVKNVFGSCELVDAYCYRLRRCRYFSYEHREYARLFKYRRHSSKL